MKIESFCDLVDPE